MICRYCEKEFRPAKATKFLACSSECYRKLYKMERDVARCPECLRTFNKVNSNHFHCTVKCSMKSYKRKAHEDVLVQLKRTFLDTDYESVLL